MGKEFRCKDLDDRVAYREGANQFKVNLNELRDILVNNKVLRDNILVGVSNSNRDGNSGLQHSSLVATRQEIYRFADFVFSSNPKDVSYFLGEGVDDHKVIQAKYGGLMPCLHGCDAHSNAEILNPDLGRFTWIKADPTFEGLRQIISEPKARVRIQTECPEQKNAYQVIKRIRFRDPKHRFDDAWIGLNPNLNSIIGGKSSGKSILIYHIARTLDPKRIAYLNAKQNGRQPTGYTFEDEQEFDFEVEWGDGSIQTLIPRGERAYRPITYIPQLYLNRLAEDKLDELHSLIEQTLLEGSLEYKIHCTELDARIQQLTTDLNQAIEEYLTLHQKIEQKSAERRQLGDKGAILQNIKAIDQQLNALRQVSEFTEEQESEYQGLLNTDLEIGAQKQLLSLRERALSVARETVRNRIADLADDIIKTISQAVEAVVTEVDSSVYEEVYRIANSISRRLMNEGYAAIDSEFAIVNGVQELLHELTARLEDINNRLKPYQSKIQNQEAFTLLQDQKEKELSRKEKIDIAESEIKALRARKSLDKVMALYEQRFAVYREIVEATSQYGTITGARGLVVSCELEFDTQAFQSNFMDQINKRTPLEAQFEVAFTGNEYEFSPESHIQMVSEIALRLLDNNIAYKRGFDLESAFRGLLGDYLQVRYNLHQKGDDIMSMSPGKRGILLFELFLHLNNSRDPILIDQPEDNLDNRTIYQELNDFIRAKKVDRQIIIVTHNANLVVSTDSENVIVANQQGQNVSAENRAYRFEYINGPLECAFKNDREKGVLYCKGIREHVCEILEGGVEAFEKRERKYGFSRSR